MSTQVKTYLTPEEYLALERRAETKSEYFNGEMFEMPRANRKHNLISGNIVSQLTHQLKKTACETYASTMRLRILTIGLYTYPDIVAVCDKPEFEDDEEDTLLNPTVIIEVLSDATESYDRGKKFSYYRSIESITEYLLVAQDECRDRAVRQTSGRLLAAVGSRLARWVSSISFRAVRIAVERRVRQDRIRMNFAMGKSVDALDLSRAVYEK